jgi:hypothetical protein
VTRGRYQRLLLLGLGAVSATAAATEVVWPTSMDRSLLRSPEDYLQPTESGRLESGAFGMVRDDGHRFHEGLDIRPAGRTKSGEPTDLVFSAMEGVVTYVNARPNGTYGRYVVMLHPRAELPVYTLYAHLASLQPGLKAGQTLAAGKVLGVMGRSSTSETAIPRERAHLHFEVGLMLSERFQAWYDADADNRGVPNHHGVFNGQNLIGFDPTLLLARSSADVRTLLRDQPVALAITLRPKRTPDFLTRYPALLKGGDSATAAGWYVEFSWQGMPIGWTALPAGDPRLRPGPWSLYGVKDQFRPQLIRRRMLTANGKAAGDTLIRQVEILTANSR